MLEEVSKPTQRRFLAFCVNFPQDLPAEIKVMFNRLLNDTNTVIPRIKKKSTLHDFPLGTNLQTFVFKNDASHLDIFYSLRSIMDQCQRGKNPSIVFGTPHYGFDLVFVDLWFANGSFVITDSYLIQNAFITQLEHSQEESSVYASFEGFYGENQAVSELAKTLVEQNIKSKQPPKDEAAPTEPAA